MDILENADEYRKEPNQPPAPMRKVTPEFDENKNTEQLWREGKLGKYESDEFILGIDSHGPAKYKIMLEDITRVNRITYLPDALDIDITTGAVRYIVAHKGRRGSDLVTEEDFNNLVQRPELKDKVIYYLVDMNDPIEGRFSYTGSKPDFLTSDMVKKSREARAEALAKEKRPYGESTKPRSRKAEEADSGDEGEGQSFTEWDETNSGTNI